MKTEPDALEQDLADSRQRVENALERWLPADDQGPQTLNRAMRYAVMGGGKRVRPHLVYAAGAALGIPAKRLDGPACAVEIIHCYSLVHDDLPAMDDDDLRRGRPTCHRAFDEATAILAGDALQSLAFEILASDRMMIDDPARRLAMVASLARAGGPDGMAGGQALDLDAVGRRLDIRDLERMHARKTGALIEASVRLATLSHPEPAPERAQALVDYARDIGLAFQIRDDILDVTGDTAVIGKQQGADLEREKPTYVSQLGLDGARQRADDLVGHALEGLQGFGDDAAALRRLAEYIVRRSH